MVEGQTCKYKKIGNHDHFYCIWERTWGMCLKVSRSIILQTISRLDSEGQTPKKLNTGATEDQIVFFFPFGLLFSFIFL